MWENKNEIMLTFKWKTNKEWKKENKAHILKQRMTTRMKKGSLGGRSKSKSEEMDKWRVTNHFNYQVKGLITVHFYTFTPKNKWKQIRKPKTYAMAKHSEKLSLTLLINSWSPFAFWSQKGCANACRIYRIRCLQRALFKSVCFSNNT